MIGDRGKQALVLLLIVTAWMPAARTHAQATANALAVAEDAFGATQGAESIGIYDETAVRGFSLEAAGNYRINGRYFVKNSGSAASSSRRRSYASATTPCGWTIRARPGSSTTGCAIRGRMSRASSRSVSTRTSSRSRSCTSSTAARMSHSQRPSA